jgi:HAD superfamily hydrolase (TIGR01509 family)
MSSSSNIRALLLDLDGTIADTHELIFQCFSETFRRHVGRECSRAVWETRVGLPLEEMFAAALEGMGTSGPEPGLLVARYREHLAEIDGAVRVFPEIPAVLAALHEDGLRLALVTSKHEPSASRHLRYLGLEHRFEVIVTGDQCERCKPDPEPFARALAALGVPASEAAAVGDSEADVLGARAAGVLAAAACWGTMHRDALLAARPDLVLEQPRDLLRFLRPGGDPPVRIRAARLDDAAAIAGVHIDSWRSTYRGIVPDDYLALLSHETRTRMWSRGLSDAESRNCCYVAEEPSGEIIGFASGGPERTGDPEYAGELSGIYLLESHQRQGIGRRLVQVVVERLAQAGLHSMLVWVLADNRSRGFYEALDGELVREGKIEIGGVGFDKVAYGWSDTAVILRDSATPASLSSRGK